MTQIQHTDLYRKVLLRQSLLKYSLPGAAYVPFCGDGDLAHELYKDRGLIGCDTDPDRIATVRARLPDGHWQQADADKGFLANIAPVMELPMFAVADFDAYAYPYAAFRDFWATAPKTPRVVLFFTDGQRMSMMVNGSYLSSYDGSSIPLDLDVQGAKRAATQRYFHDKLVPWLEAAVAPARVVRTQHYNRSQMLYWGAVVEQPGIEDDPDVFPIGNVRPDIDKMTDEQLGYNPLIRQAFSPLKKRQLLKLVSEGDTRTAAARKVGVTLRTVNRHIEQYPEFAEAISWCEMEADDEVENALYLAAKSGSVSAIAMWLYNRRPDKWMDRRHVRLEIDHAALAKVADVINRIVTDPETRDALRRELAALAAEGSNT